MVKNIIRVLFITFSFIAVSCSFVTNSEASFQRNTFTIVSKNAPIRRHKKAVIPTIILGILTLILTISVLYVRIKVTKEMKKRRQKHDNFKLKG